MRSILSRVLSIFAVLLSLAAFGLGQGNPDRNSVAQPAEAQVAKYKRLWELLKHPTFIAVRLASMPKDVSKETPSTTPSVHVVGETLHFQSFITQTLNDDILIVGDRSPYS